MDLDIKISEENGCTILRPEGRIDTQTAKSFQEKCVELIESGKIQVVFDFEEVSFLSSMGLRVILTTVKTLKSKGGNLSLCCASADVSQVLTMSGFHNFLSMYDTVDEAVQP